MRPGAPVAGMVLLAAALSTTPVPSRAGPVDAESSGQPALDRETASAYSHIALGCIDREYPNKPGHVIGGEEEVLPPSELHPSFYGCFDWHSSVHGHWMLVRILGLFPDLPEADRIRQALDDDLAASKIEAEAAYFRQDNRKSFERTYGWAWLLKLAGELRTCPDPVAEEWAANIEPLADLISRRYIEFLPRQSYPIRRGVHPNTAFGIAFALDYARIEGDRDLEALLTGRALDYYLEDGGCPGGWEPDGDDFFSPCLMEADLMRRILPAGEFGEWLERFLPGLDAEEPRSLLHPVEVSDRTDPKIVHLDGLNISRAWCLAGIASALEETDPRRSVLERASRRHAEAGLSNVASGNYEGEHWLASFAVYLLASD